MRLRGRYQTRKPLEPAPHLRGLRINGLTVSLEDLYAFFSNLFLRENEWRAEFIVPSMTRRRPWLLVRGCPTVWDLQVPFFRISRRNGCRLVHPAAGCQICSVPRPLIRQVY